MKLKQVPMSISEMIVLYGRGLSSTDIGKMVGLDKGSIQGRLKRAGVILRNRSEAIKIAHRQGKCPALTGKKFEQNPLFKGGFISQKGYRRIGHNQVEHRVVWERENGPLPPGWVVHHLNGIKSDNRIENLYAMPNKSHSPTLIVKPFQDRIRDLESIMESKGWRL